MSKGEFAGCLAKAFILLASYSVDGSLHHIFMDWRHMSEVLTAGKHAYTELTNVCVRVGDKGGAGSHYAELVFIFKSGEDKHRNNFSLAKMAATRARFGTIRL